MSDDTAIAIIGRAARLPGARTVEDFWENLERGVESRTELTDDQLLAAGVPQEQLDDPNYCRTGMFMDDVEMFDAGFFGFSPRDASILDPQHRHFFEVSWEALEDAGHVPSRFAGSIGVFAGCGHSAYLANHLLMQPELVEEVGFFLLRHTGNDKDFLATRLSYLLDLKGPSINVQTACSTSLVAVHLACQSLLNGECDMALAGSVTIELPPRRGYEFREGEILSADGHCRPFDASAGGTQFGSGAGAVVLRRLDDALTDRDRIHAVIRGSAVNNDGSGKVSYLAPSVDGQADCVHEALALADENPETITYIECHGTGTALGDPIEIAALSAAFAAYTDKKQFCDVGSVKSNIGHLDTTAGVASLIKTVEALRRGKIPATLHYRRPNPEIDFPSTPFRVNASLKDWKSDGPRRAGVNSLGVGGTNAFVIVEQAPPQPPADAERADQLLPLSARSLSALDEASDRLATHLRNHQHIHLPDVAYTLQTGRAPFAHRRVLACHDVDEAVEALLSRGDHYMTGQAPAGERSVTFMFPGGGAQYPNMARDLYDQEPVFRDEVDRCLTLLNPRVDFDLKELLYPVQADVDRAARELRRPTRSLTALFITQYAQARLWMSWGVEPTALVGHSLGENTAACIAGVISLEDALGLVLLRGQLFERLERGGMVSVALSPNEIEALLGDGLTVAAINAPDYCVASGPIGRLEDLERALDERDVDHQRIRIETAAHSPMLDPILADFGAYLDSVELHEPRIPFLSNVSGTWIEPHKACAPSYWVDHLRSTVRFSDCIGELLADDSRVLLEVGPGRALTSLAGMHPSKTSSHTLLTSSGPREDPGSDVRFMLTALGQLWQAGVPVDWERLHQGEARRRVSLPAYPFEHARHWVEPGETRMSATPDALDERADLSDWFHLPVWTPSAPPERGDATGRRYLVFHNDHAISRGLVNTLRECANDVVIVTDGEQYARTADDAFTVRASAAEDFQAMLGELCREERPPDEIAHLWNLTPDGDPGTREASFDSLVFLAQALGAEDLVQPVRITVASNELQQVGGESIAPLKSLLLGPCSVIPSELPNVVCRSIDFSTHSAEKMVAQLLAEVTGDASDYPVAYRGGRRWTRGFATSRLESCRESRIRDGGVYLITGGLRGLGLWIAESLAKKAQVKLVLLGRSEPTLAALDRVAAIEALGSEVLIARADVTDPEAMAEVVASARRRFGGIRGAIHAAGVLRDGLIQLKEPGAVDAVLAPKVAGTKVLAESLSGEPLDFLALFSSVSSFAGLAGQVDYAAASAFLDAFAHDAAQRGGPVSVSINWPAWRGIGMAARMATDGAERATGRGVAHPLLGNVIEGSNGGATFEADYSLATHWVLREHRLRGGNCLLPGSAFLELARAALADCGGESAVEMSDVFFMAPFFVGDEEVRPLRVTLDGDEFRVTSTEEHVRGEIRRIEPPDGAKQSVPDLLARCAERAEEYAGSAPHPAIEFGPRWSCLQRVDIGHNEAVATLDLPEEYRADLEHYALHPSLVDTATAGAQTLIQDYDPDSEFYVPVGYMRLRCAQRLPPRLYSHIRYRPNEAGKHSHDIAIFNVTVMDESGAALIEIEEFTMKRIGNLDQLLAIQDTRAAGNGAGAALAGEKEQIERTLALGIDPENGAEAFHRIIDSGTTPQVAVASRDLEALCAELQFKSEAPASKARAADAESDPALAEVEAVLRAHPAISEVAVLGYQSGPDERRVVAHVVYDEFERATVTELRKYVRNELDNPIVPQYFAERDELPSDRRELVDPFAPIDDYVAPRSDTEKLLAGIWCNVLGIGRVSLHDNFFDIGGHSLLSIRVIMRLQKELGVELNQAIMVLQTLEQIAREIDTRTGSHK